MTDEHDQTEASPPTDRLRMDLYRLLHDRAESERKWQFWRLAAGHLVVGTVLAYAFATRRWRFLALTPVLYGVVVIDGLKYGIRMLYLQERLVDVETRLADRDPAFDWVSEYGFFGAGREVRVDDVDLNKVPEMAQFVLIATIYLGLVAAALLAWGDDPAPGAPGVPVSRALLALGYASFTAVFALIVGVGYLHYRRVQRRIGAHLDGD